MKHEAAAAERKPVDHIRVRGGRIYPDDLVYSYMTGEWLRHDDARWQSRCEYVADAVYVARYAEPKIRIRREPEPVSELLGDGANEGQLQRNLFGL